MPDPGSSHVTCLSAFCLPSASCVTLSSSLPPLSVPAQLCPLLTPCLLTLGFVTRNSGLQYTKCLRSVVYKSPWLSLGLKPPEARSSGQPGPQSPSLQTEILRVLQAFVGSVWADTVAVCDQPEDSKGQGAWGFLPDAAHGA